jgi:hypothetical protein
MNGQPHKKCKWYNDFRHFGKSLIISLSFLHGYSMSLDIAGDKNFDTNVAFFPKHFVPCLSIKQIC